MSYSVQITECSKELNARERIRIKDTSSASKLDTIVNENGSVTFTPVYYGTLLIHNDNAKGDDKEYEKYFVVDSEDKVYTTSSAIWYDSFININTEMCEDGQPYNLVTYKGVSNNGNTFLTCTVE